jgi:aminoglycoside 3-N-acetyltransferase
MVTRQDIKNGLIELGLRAGDTVVVHSSLKSFGEVEGGADAVVDALLEALGPEGTLVVPTFNFEPGVFDHANTPSIVGKITEAVRARPDAIRSNHPTHSVTAIGRLADDITAGHEKVDAFARGSALHKAARVGAKILQLGVTQTTNSTIHVAEELAKVPYLDRQRYVGIKQSSDKVIHKWIRRPGCSQGFNAIDEALYERDAIAEVMIGDCKARLMSARTLIDTAVELLKSDPDALLCSRPDCGICAESRAMISARESEAEERMIVELAEEEERIRRQAERQLSGDVSYFEPDGKDMRSPN